jgi:hypothetical protein
MYRNKKLKESLQLLSKTTYSLLNKKPRPVDSCKDDSSNIILAFHRIEPKIKEISEFKICTELMAQDGKIKALQGKLVGTCSGLSSVPNEETCILSFLERVYQTSRKYDQIIFDKEYRSFENLFYSENYSGPSFQDSKLRWYPAKKGAGNDGSKAKEFYG